LTNHNQTEAQAMNKSQMESIGLPHKLFAVFTAPDGKLLFRKMWSMRLVAYLSGIGAIQGMGWDIFIKGAEVGQVWDVPLESGTWMAIVRIRDDEDRNETV
jgi:ABC-type transporter Mla subunit MlaD